MGIEATSTLAYPQFLVDTQRAQQYRQRGLALRQAGLLREAIATLKLAVALDPYRPEGYVILGWTEHLVGNHNFALQTLSRGLQQDPNHVPALNALGIVYLVEGNLEDAVDTHTRAIELKPNNEIAHYNLSLAYERLEDFPAAIDHAQRAAELEPQNPHPWVALALAHGSAGAGDLAAGASRQAIQIDGRYRDRAYLDHLKAAGFSADQITAVAAIRRASLGF
ncbi:hypothetical protein C7271_01945 [filamentous cyanobacterium CCP5]|nr:hypothetical protein C7271_01945 [filamentous cyanobacterium CCP5]